MYDDEFDTSLSDGLSLPNDVEKSTDEIIQTLDHAARKRFGDVNNRKVSADELQTAELRNNNNNDSKFLQENSADFTEFEARRHSENPVNQVASLKVDKAQIINIQAIQRGTRKTLKRIQNTQGQLCAEETAYELEAKQQKALVHDQEETTRHAAATRIQALQRGRVARKKLGEATIDQAEKELLTQELEAQALRSEMSDNHQIFAETRDQLHDRKVLREQLPLAEASLLAAENARAQEAKEENIRLQQVASVLNLRVVLHMLCRSWSWLSRS